MFCLNALIEFSRVYEAEKPEMTIKASLNDRSIGSIGFELNFDLAAPNVTVSLYGCTDGAGTVLDPASVNNNQSCTSSGVAGKFRALV